MPHFTVPFSQGAPVIDLIVSASAPRLAVFSESGIPQGFHALIGRDILANCILVYNGGNSTMIVSY